MHTRLDEPIRGRSFAYTAIECDWPIGLPSAKTERTNQRAMLVFPGFVAVFFFSFSGRTKKINEPMADAASGASFPAKINGLHRQKKNQEDKKETKTSKKRNVVFADIGFSFLSFFFWWLSTFDIDFGRDCLHAIGRRHVLISGLQSSCHEFYWVLLGLTEFS